jgi:hypothetical protein
LHINGREVIGNLDTGSNSSFQLTPRGIRKIDLNRLAASSKPVQSTGFNGSYQSHSGKVKSIDVGSVHLDAPEVTFWMPKTGHDSCQFDVNIGSAFWADYVVTIDYVHHTVWLSH